VVAVRRNRRTTREQSRDAMLELLERRGIRDRCVLAGMTYVPREPFVAPSDVLDAYADRPLAIGHGQTLSQPYVVALMLQALQLDGDEHLLEIGTGSGYTAALLSQLTAHVYSVERDPTLASTARARLGALGYDGIDVTCRDGTLGWIEHAPYDAIVVGAAAPEVPRALVDQLAVGGRLVMPVGSRDAQVLRLVTKTGEDTIISKDLGAVAFVPLVGAQGFSDIGPLDSE
jgi:protein-L-isoaspartate(D-aspartate) O-methyltransferase